MFWPFYKFFFSKYFLKIDKLNFLASNWCPPPPPFKPQIEKINTVKHVDSMANKMIYQNFGGNKDKSLQKKYFVSFSNSICAAKQQFSAPV